MRKSNTFVPSFFPFMMNGAAFSLIVGNAALSLRASQHGIFGR